MEIKVKKVYSYDPCDAEPCVCTLTVYLPTDKYGYLKEELHSRKVLLGRTLTNTWGWAEDGWRVRDQVVRGTSWEDADSKADALIEQIKDTITDVLYERKEMLKSKPTDKEITIVIGC